MRDFHRTHRATPARVRRVNDALAAWDEHEAALARADLFPVPEAPRGSRAPLKSLEQTLIAAIAEQEATWERTELTRATRTHWESAKSPQVALGGDSGESDGGSTRPPERPNPLRSHPRPRRRSHRSRTGAPQAASGAN